MGGNSVALKEAAFFGAVATKGRLGRSQSTITGGSVVVEDLSNSKYDQDSDTEDSPVGSRLSSPNSEILEEEGEESG